MKKQIVPVLVLAGGLALTGCASHQAVASRQVVVRPNGEIVVPEPPPTGRSDVVPPAPNAADVWMPGFWSYHNNHWAWVEGYWEAPPRAGATWVPGHWDHITGGWVWNPGHWE